MKLETENVLESEASAELIRELMADDAKRGNWLILMHDDDEEAFMQIAFDDHSDGIDLEYRDGADKPLYHCKRPGAWAAKLINTPTEKEGLIGTFRFKLALLGSVETFAIFALVGTLVFSARLSA